MAKKKSWFNIVKRFFVSETKPKTHEKVDHSISKFHFVCIHCIFQVCITWFYVRVYMNIIPLPLTEGEEKEMAIWKAKDQKVSGHYGTNIIVKRQNITE